MSRLPKALFVVSLIAGFLVACGGSSSLTGLWTFQEVDGVTTYEEGEIFDYGETLEFFENGKVIIQGASFDYEWLDEETLEFRHPFATLAFRARVDQDRLYLDSTRGSASAIFARVDD